MNYVIGERKFVSVGGSLICAVPKTWLKNQNLSAGDEITFTLESDGSLRIVPSAESEAGNSMQRREGELK